MHAAKYNYESECNWIIYDNQKAKAKYKDGLILSWSTLPQPKFL